MELRQLEYFVAIAEELHFGRAAARLRVTQPTLSQQIQRLERELDVTVFRRNSHSVELTASGALLFDQARLIMDLAGDAVRAARYGNRQQPRGAGGAVRIGFVCSVAQAVLPSALRLFRHTHPAAILTLKELGTGDQLAALAGNRLDIAFVFGPVRVPTLHTVKVSREPFVLLLPAIHPLSKRARLDIRDLEALPMALFRRQVSPPVYDRVHATAMSSGVSLKVAHEVDDPRTIPLLVATDGVVGLLPATHARQAQVPGIVARALAGVCLDEEVHLVWRADEASTAVAAFVNSVTPEYGQPATRAA